MTWKRNQKLKYNYGLVYDKPIPKPRKSTSWTSPSYKSIKVFIKKHYSIFQDNKCAYCRMPINFGGYGDPIEHIVPKSHKTFWMFHPKNLCLSCYGCNTKKRDKNTLLNDHVTYSNAYKNYPTNSADFKIVHPTFDNYSKHIKINGIFCTPKDGSIKGANTIEICQLNRLDLIHKRVLYNRISRKKINEIYMEKLRDTSTPKYEMDAITNYAKKLAENYNYKKKVLASKNK